MGLFSSPPDPRLSAALSRIEAKLDAIMDHLGLERLGDTDADVRELVLRGSKIEAIKLHRERHGVGLAEAKAAIDAM